MREFQPMLASPITEADLKNLSYPRYNSPKLDGIRAVIRNGVVLSRKLKPIPSQLVQDAWGREEFNGLDGEFITGPANASNVFRRTTSAIMTFDGDPMEVNATHFHTFDMVVQGVPYEQRRLASMLGSIKYPSIISAVPQLMCHTPEELTQHEQDFVEAGFEGLMTRSIMGFYKFGRSTVREGYLLKLKRFADAEYEVTGFEERMHNANELQTDERGYAKRSSHQENLVGTGFVGSILGRSLTGPYAGRDIKVSPTGPHTTLAAVQHMLGTTRVYKYFPSGSKDLPRFPTDKGPRHD